ncbi:MAG: methyltransferase domain-containing protein [Burkholderiaceae bacterium]
MPLNNLPWIKLQPMDSPTASVRFFDEQFQRQIAAENYELNPFELAALPYLRGKTLDFGCGMGNLAIQAARNGCSVVALDASDTAIEHLKAVAQRRKLPITATEADLRTYELSEDFDSAACIGLLMFFDCTTAYRQLGRLQDRVRPGGHAVVNVLIEGTTFMDMFSPEGHCLFKPEELRRQFDGWQLLSYIRQEFPAPGNTRKVFVTAIAHKPAAPGNDV